MKSPEYACGMNSLPDVAIAQNLNFLQPIDWVGMGAIQIPLMLKLSESVINVIAKIEVMVSLDLSPSRGIHMSRLYTLVQSLGQSPLTMESLSALCLKFIESQNTQSLLSSAARLRLDFELPVQRKSLKSGLMSWRVYPVSLLVEQRQNKNKISLVDFKFLYSSTCPASAALARDLNSNHFLSQHDIPSVEVKTAAEFLKNEAGMIATPHAQRSEAHVQILVQDSFVFPQIAELIDMLEGSLGTPVQGSVKREDEQEFARLNGTNLMFCEDAVRKLAGALNQEGTVAGYRLQVSHFESLHAHNAVSILKKNFNFSG